MLNSQRDKRLIPAFSLTEMILAISLFSLIVLSISGFVIDTLRFSENNWNRIFSSLKLQEVSNAIITSKNDLWLTIVQGTNTGHKYLNLVNNKYQIFDGQITENDITSYFDIVNAYRDSSGNLTTTATNNTIENGSRGIVLTAFWTDAFGTLNNYNQTFYVTNWKTFNWNETTQADFASGDTSNSVAVTSTAGGEIQQTTILFADWCKPSVTLSGYDLPGQGVAKAIMAQPNNAYAGTGENASGIALSHIIVDDTDPPNVVVPGTFNGYKANGVFGEGNIGYIATDDNAKEAVIVDLSSQPFTEIGYFNAPNNTDGVSIFVSNNRGYLTTANNRLYIFNLSSKTGSRPQLGVITLQAKGSRVVVNGNYAYVSIAGAAVELQIINITNPSSPSSVGQADVNGEAALDVYVNSSATRAYLATGYSASLPEFFIINIATKTGNRPLIGSYSAGTMSPLGVISTPDNSNKAILVGTGGQEYQVIDMANETNPTKCGGIDIDTGVYGIIPVTNTLGNVYSYIVTGDVASEFKILRGGPGGGNSQGIGYPPESTYTSSVFDTGSSGVVYYTLSWTETAAPNADLKFQVRAGTTSDLSAQPWVGPDGTSGSYFTVPNGEYLPSSLNGKRYIQYKAFFYCYDTINTIVFNDMTINYQR